jgi:hypothetical protein
MVGSVVSAGFAVGCAVVAVASPLAGVPDVVDVPLGLHAATEKLIQAQARRARMMRTRERFIGLIGFIV